MATDFFVIALLVASLAAFAFVWLRLRIVERKLEEGSEALADVARAVRSECLPLVGEGARLAKAAIDRLDAERAAALADARTSQDRLATVLDELSRASERFGEARGELGRAVERLGAHGVGAEAAREGDRASLEQLARAHLLSIGVASVNIDGVAAKPDGAHVVRARGLRGSELWVGNVVIRAGRVESATALSARMFP